MNEIFSHLYYAVPCLNTFHIFDRKCTFARFDLNPQTTPGSLVRMSVHEIAVDRAEDPGIPARSRVNVEVEAYVGFQGVSVAVRFLLEYRFFGFIWRVNSKLVNFRMNKKKKNAYIQGCPVKNSPTFGIFWKLNELNLTEVFIVRFIKFLLS